MKDLLVEIENAEKLLFVLTARTLYGFSEIKGFHQKSTEYITQRRKQILKRSDPGNPIQFNSVLFDLYNNNNNNNN